MAKYVKLLKENTEKNEKKDFALLESNALISCEELQLALKKEINKLKASIAKGKASDRFNANFVIEDILSLKIAETRLEELDKLMKELF